ncbi:unnamed protein product [Schistocephalus solidus]|uniref:Uncharacterized protein n=1 Tax=Schistocephalus solidus TaxID=70667 RepID=A0A183SHZ2_SCHSO|nr:unnamed protein product [Schistocephalus solidus]
MNLRTDATTVAFFRCHRLVQQQLREMQDFLMVKKAEEIQGQSTASASRGSHRCSALTMQILKRWAEPFRSILNCSSAISDAAIDRLHQLDTKNDLDMLPSLPETIQAVQQISSKKAPGSDAIPPEVNKHGGPRLIANFQLSSGDVAPRTSSSGFQRHEHRPSIQADGELATL